MLVLFASANVNALRVGPLQAQYHVERLRVELQQQQDAQAELQRCSESIQQYAKTAVGKNKIIRHLIKETDAVLTQIHRTHAQLRGQSQQHVAPLLEVQLTCGADPMPAFRLRM